ncbi:MAG: hypothetical protein ACYCYE_12065 [Clostridia bacterium]
MYKAKSFSIIAFMLIILTFAACSNNIDSKYQEKEVLATTNLIENYKKISTSDDTILRLPVNSAQYGINDNFLICAENEVLRSDNLNQISLYDLASKKKKVLAYIEDSRFQIDEPQIGNKWAAWVEWDRERPSHYTIYKYNLTGGEKSIIKSSDLDTKNMGLVRLVMYDDRLVATENTYDENFSDVNIYDLKNNTYKNLGKSLISELPEIQGDFVAWKGVDEKADKVAIFVYNLSTGEKKAIKDVTPDVTWIQIDEEYILLHTTSKLSIYSLKDLSLIRTIESGTGFFNADMEDGIISWSSYDENNQVFLYSMSNNNTFVIDNKKGFLPRLFNGSLLFTYSEYPQNRDKAYKELHIIDNIKSKLASTSAN